MTSFAPHACRTIMHKTDRIFFSQFNHSLRLAGIHTTTASVLSCTRIPNHHSRTSPLLNVVKSIAILCPPPLCSRSPFMFQQQIFFSSPPLSAFSPQQPLSMVFSLSLSAFFRSGFALVYCRPSARFQGSRSSLSVLRCRVQSVISRVFCNVYAVMPEPL